MKTETKRKIARLAISTSMLIAIKLQDPTVTYLSLLTASPVAYTVAEKVVGSDQKQKKDQ